MADRQQYLNFENQKSFLFLICLFVFFFVGEYLQEYQNGREKTDAEINKLTTSPTPVVHISIWWNPQIAERDLNLVTEAGFTWVKQRFPWREIQGAGNGPYDWYRSDIVVDLIDEAGLNLIARLDAQPWWTQEDGGKKPLMNAPPADLSYFGDYCFAIASRYKGRIDAYQIWNEPNLAREWGDSIPDPEAYVDLLKVCYDGIKNADANAIVISAGLAPTGTDNEIAMPDDKFLRQMYEAGASDYFDMLGVHGMGFKASPETAPGEVAESADLGGHRWMSFRHVEDYREIMIEYGDAEKQIAIMEMGWTTDPIHPAYSWFSVTEEEQATYLVNAYKWATENWQPWIGFMTTIYLPDPYWTTDDEQYWWAITYPDFPETRVRPAYDALREYFLG